MPTRPNGTVSPMANNTNLFRQSADHGSEPIDRNGSHEVKTWLSHDEYIKLQQLCGATRDKNRPYKGISQAEAIRRLIRIGQPNTSEAGIQDVQFVVPIAGYDNVTTNNPLDVNDSDPWYCDVCQFDNLGGDICANCFAKNGTIIHKPKEEQ